MELDVVVCDPVRASLLPVPRDELEVDDVALLVVTGPTGEVLPVLSDAGEEYEYGGEGG